MRRQNDSKMSFSSKSMIWTRAQGTFYCWQTPIYPGKNAFFLHERIGFTSIEKEILIAIQITDLLYLHREIDEAFLRRFERKILIDLPSCENRASIINHLLPTTKQWHASKMKQLVDISDGFTGADLRIACKEASMVQLRNKLKSNGEAIQKMPEISFDDLMASMKQTKPSMTASAVKHRQWHAKFGNESV